MIKNLLYSLFLHFILLLSIYISFNLKPVQKTSDNEVLVSLVQMPLSKPITKKKKEPPVEAQKPKTVPPKEKIKKALKKVKKKSPKKLKEIKKKKVVAKKKNKKKTKIKKKTKPKKLPEPLNKEIEKPKTIKPVDKEKDIVLDKPTKKEIEEESTELENLDLSVREKLNMRSQLKRCYSRAIREADFSSKTMVTIVIQIDEYGYISSNLDTILDEKRYNDPEESNFCILRLLLS